MNKSFYCLRNKDNAIDHKIEEVKIDLDTRTVSVKSSMPAEELLEVIKKTGKTTTYVGVKN
ncbi:hypothetical protein Bhyg_03967 [Pseudolycoriella hygida]|uniref:HMA domain-containing protein n=1 Tax=Pseudolycoriella hygida TaxID=35572 RepID=A0A9Q0NFU8_9DIPT|nr:hypothetical protein Bhyg_03967 [Pseudolycoriella hygida]